MDVPCGLLKLIKEDWSIVLQYEFRLYTTFITKVQEYKVGLKQKN